MQAEVSQLANVLTCLFRVSGRAKLGLGLEVGLGVGLRGRGRARGRARGTMM